MTDEQLHLDGVPPTRLKRTRAPKPMHLPTAEDAEALREWLRKDTSLPGVVAAQLAGHGAGTQFKLLGEIPAKLVVTTRERARLLALADKWERDAIKRGG